MVWRKKSSPSPTSSSPAPKSPTTSSSLSNSILTAPEAPAVHSSSSSVAAKNPVRSQPRKSLSNSMIASISLFSVSTAATVAFAVVTALGLISPPVLSFGIFISIGLMGIGFGAFFMVNSYFDKQSTVADEQKADKPVVASADVHSENTNEPTVVTSPTAEIQAKLLAQEAATAIAAKKTKEKAEAKKSINKQVEAAQKAKTNANSSALFSDAEKTVPAKVGVIETRQAAANSSSPS